MAVIDPHYVWALGHIVMLFGSAYILFQTVLFRGTPKWTYKLSYTGALISYFIVVLKSLGTPRLDTVWMQRAFADENVQYAVLALYWWISKPIALTIIPFAIFSLFHTLTFIRTNILPKFVPPPPPAQAGQPRPPPALMENISRQFKSGSRETMIPPCNSSLTPNCSCSLVWYLEHSPSNPASSHPSSWRTFYDSDTTPRNLLEKQSTALDHGWMPRSIPEVGL